MRIGTIVAMHPMGMVAHRAAADLGEKSSHFNGLTDSVTKRYYMDMEEN
jgi:hypothetical protein